MQEISLRDLDFLFVFSVERTRLKSLLRKKRRKDVRWIQLMVPGNSGKVFTSSDDSYEAEEREREDKEERKSARVVASRQVSPSKERTVSESRPSNPPLMHIRNYRRVKDGSTDAEQKTLGNDQNRW